MTFLAIFILLVFLHSLVSARLERTVITSPMVFTAAGLFLFLVVPAALNTQFDRELFLRVPEVGLVLLLFTDASRTDLGVLKSIRSLPVRLLSTGMLLTIVLGGVFALVILRKLSIWEAGILSAILAPTDAGLGQMIVASPRVPLKIRQALNVEAGLNDGLSVPFLLFFIALGTAGVAGAHTRFTTYVVEQLGYGALVGGGIGIIGGWLLGTANDKHWISAAWQQLGLVALPLFCALASEAVGASMFIAAFVAGLTVQVGFGEAGSHSVEFTEEWGQLFNLAVFFLFGIMVSRVWHQFNLVHLAYALVSLTVVRMLPVAIALRNTGLSRSTVLFMGWFGPRGLASIVLGLVYLEQETHQPGEATIRLAVMATVMLSIFSHGLTTMPGIEFYAGKLKSLRQDAPEFEGVNGRTDQDIQKR